MSKDSDPIALAVASVFLDKLQNSLLQGEAKPASAAFKAIPDAFQDEVKKLPDGKLIHSEDTVVRAQVTAQALQNIPPAIVGSPSPSVFKSMLQAFTDAVNDVRKNHPDMPDNLETIFQEKNAQTLGRLAYEEKERRP